jgi:hypothetical protein
MDDIILYLDIPFELITVRKPIRSIKKQLVILLIE